MSTNIKWTLIPPHGMAFKNELGSEVSIDFPSHMAAELFHNLSAQLQKLFQEHIRREAEAAKPEVNAGLELNKDGSFARVTTDKVQ